MSRAAANTIIEERFARRDGYYIMRVVSHAAMDAWTDLSPMDLELRDNRCVSLGQTSITTLNIALHVFIIGELNLVYC